MSSLVAMKKIKKTDIFLMLNVFILGEFLMLNVFILDVFLFEEALIFDYYLHF